MGCKMIYLARRNPALAPGQFPQAWHVSAVTPGSRRRVVPCSDDDGSRKG